VKKPRKSRSRRLQYEALESREMMAVTGTFNRKSGALTITSNDAADTVNFKQIGSTISVNGASGSWSASKVKSIVVNLNGGDDTVSLNSLANGGNAWIAEKVTVRGGLGNEVVHLANGNDVNFSGVGSTLVVAANGVTTLNGAAINFSNSVQSSLVSGVLTITATNGNDTLLLAQDSGWVGLAGGSSWFATSQVKSIVINLQDGNDAVSHDSLALGANQAISAPVTINSGMGNKAVYFPNGHSVQFSGFGHQLKVAANGTVTLDGVVQNFGGGSGWFNTNIQDAALRALGSSLYTDGLISRGDIIALLNDAKDGNYIDGTEIADLRKMVDATSLWGGSHYLQTLTSYLAYGTVANAKYQGTSLGGLGSGAASTTMDKLVNKWFLGLDRPAAAGTYRQIAGTLFVGGAAYTDVKQGSVGDCYFVASLAEVALRSNSTITSMFVVNGDGTYGVKFRSPIGQTVYVTVDSYLPTNGAGYLVYAGMGAHYSWTSNELWVALAEKAYAQLNEFGWSRYGSDSGQNSYAALNGGFIGDALEHITGQNSTYTFTNGSTSINTFIAAWNSGKLIGFASFSAPPNVVGSHAYAVVSVNYNASNPTNSTVTFFNPWGIQYGLTTLTWAQVQQNFQYFDRTV
jgi:hypothetical protein